MFGNADKRRASIYSQLSTLEKSGIPILQSLERLTTQGGTGALMFEHTLAGLRDGLNLGDAARASDGLSRVEQEVIAAGAQAGSLPIVFQRLADDFENRAEMKRSFWRQTAYPIFLLHAAVVLPSIPLLILDGLSGFLQAVLTPLGIAYAIVIGLALLYRYGKKTAAPLVDSFVLALPVIGAVERRSSAVQGLRALELLYGNGVPILDSLQSAAAVTPNVIVAKSFDRVLDRLSKGMNLGEAFAAERKLPDYVRELINTGDATGNLDEMLNKANERLEDDVKTARGILVKIAGGFAFALAAGMVAFKVISFYSNILGQLK